MATIYVNTSMDLSAVSFVTGDTIRVTEGATLTMTSTNAVYPSFIYIDYGTFHIDGSAASTPIVLTMNTYGSNLVCASLGTFKITGAWHSLGTGNGTAGQTFTFYHSHNFPFVQVETSAGSGEYITCLNIQDKPFTDVGQGNQLGCFFRYSEATSTITFGDGTNGIVVPSGANVRVPNVFVTANIAYSTSTSSRMAIYNSGSASYDLHVCMFSSRVYWLSTSFAYSMTLQQVGLIGYSRIYRSLLNDIDGLYLAPDCGGNTSSTLELSQFVGAAYNVIAASYGNVSTSSMSNVDADLYSCAFYAINNITTTSNSAYISGSSVRANFENCLFAGGRARISDTQILRVYNCEVSRTLNGSISTASSEGLYITPCGDCEIDGLTVPQYGTMSYNAFVSLSLTSKARLKNISAAGHSNHAYLINVSSTKDIIVSDCHAGSARTTPWYFNASTNGRVLVANLTSDSGSSTNRFWGNKVRVLGVAHKGTLYSSAGVSDWPWLLCYDYGDAPTTGSLMVICNEQRDWTYYTHSANVYFNHGGTVYLPSTGEWLIWEIPEIIYSVTGFQNVAPTLPSNATTEYQIALPGYDWPTSWTAATAANLYAESVSPTIGFRMRFRFTATSSSIFTRVQFPVTVDSTYQFPVELSTLKINGMVSGSMVKVTKTSDSSVLYTGTANQVDIEYAGEVRVVIRKGTGSPAYKQWDTITTLVSDQTTEITALQELDE